jgi:regulatory protein SWI6
LRAELTALIQTFSTEFNLELKAKQDALDVTQAHLRAATRELSEQRKQIQHAQAKCTEFDQLQYRARNLRKMLEGGDQIDWTGRTELGGNDASSIIGPSFRKREPMSEPAVSATVGAPDPDPPLPNENTRAALIRLRRMRLWQSRMEALLLEHAKTLQGASLTRELQYRKLVALCQKDPIDKIDEV